MGSVQQRMVLGFEQCLSDALFQGPQQLQEGSPGGGLGEPSGDPLGALRAALALRLLHLASAQPAPNLAHLLLGFDVSSGPRGGVMAPPCSPVHAVLVDIRSC